MTVFRSYWRCDDDGEVFVVSVEPCELEPDGTPIRPAEGVDMIWESPAPCPICGGPMRRIVSILDNRSFEAIGS